LLRKRNAAEKQQEKKREEQPFHSKAMVARQRLARQGSKGEPAAWATGE
jgi:hypothetical protein